jgi:hypothetical protein
MANTVIELRHSRATGNVPTSLANGELAINTYDGKLFYRGGVSNTIQTITRFTGPAGLDTEVQFNDSGSLGSSGKLSFNKTTGLLTVDGTVRANIFSDDGTDLLVFANSAFNTANTIQTYVTSANANISLLQTYVTTANANIATILATNTTQNTNITAAFSQANAAYTRANNSLNANTGGTVTGDITATSFITTGAFGNITGANTVYANNFVANTGFIQFSDGSKQYTANAGSGGGTTDQVARDTANAAFIKANTGTSGANSFGQIIANVGTILATSSNDSLQIVGESGISVSSNVSAKKIIISVPAGFTFTTADYGFVTDSTNIIYDYGTI